MASLLDDRFEGARNAPELADLLCQAAEGDVDSFMDFYDRTSVVTFRYALAVQRGDRPAAERLTRGIYLDAWHSAAKHAGSDLSPLAWLIVVKETRDLREGRASEAGRRW